MIQDNVLALTDHVVLPVSAVLNAIKEIKKKGNEQTDPLVITQVALIGQPSLFYLNYILIYLSVLVKFYCMISSILSLLVTLRNWCRLKCLIIRCLVAYNFPLHLSFY